MSFLNEVFSQLETAGDDTVLAELRPDSDSTISGKGLLQQVSRARAFLRTHKLQKGDRCVLLGHNSIHWVAADLAIMAEGLIVVPLYARQAPVELVAMMKDSAPALLCCGDSDLRRQQIEQQWPEAPPSCLLEEVISHEGAAQDPAQLADSDPVTIIYTSGTSGEAKGVVLNSGNIGHMLGCTSERLDQLMENRPGQDRVFHYLPFCFAGSWIMLLTCLLRRSHLALNTDLNRLAGDMRAAAPDYFLNVPALLERMRKAVDEQIWQTGGLVRAIYSRAKAAWIREREGHATFPDSLALTAARSLILPTVRKKMIGPALKALICGSAPLNPETQLFFAMLGIPVLQVYGLTETTAICTMDDPSQVETGRVGPAVRGIEMKLGENDEILVRGPNIFPGYWNRPQETAKVLRDGWFHSGDQGEVNGAGNWRIIGRIKNLIILGSGHNIAPEPIEDAVLQHLPGAQQVVLVGNGRGYLSAVVTGPVTEPQVQAALDQVNARLPHYKQVRAFRLHPESFSVDNGLLTANGKLKRDAITARLNLEIEDMYRARQAS